MKALNLNEVQEAQEFEQVKPCGYVCEITSVEDVPAKEYLKIEFDIAAGKLTGYYRNRYNTSGFWLGNLIRSYKTKALPFFKGFVTAVEKSNPGYKWDNNENSLIGKKVGLVIAEEEYEAKDGNVKIRNYVASVHEIQKIINNDFKVPELKKLAGNTAPAPAQTAPLADFEEIAAGPVPF